VLLLKAVEVTEVVYTTGRSVVREQEPPLLKMSLNVWWGFLLYGTFA
jgi:hypothetical protein